MDKSFKTIIMGIKKWLKKRVAIVSLAMSGIEKNALGQNGEQLSIPVSQERKHTQGTLADSLLNGIITKEVDSLRWCTYKILKASDGVIADITGYDDDGLPIIKIRRANKKRGLSKIKIDDYDNYPLEMVLDNSPIIISGNESMGNDNINLSDEPILNLDENGEVISATHGEISGLEYFTNTKGESPIKVNRTSLPKFEIEKYTTKLNVRTINEKDKLLEFCVSQYPNDDDRRSRLFISDIKKAIENPRVSTILDINEIEFITYKTLGVDDFLEYKYKIKSFDKIVLFNGSYVIKFLGEVIINGVDILEKYRNEALDIKYENKEKKIRTYDNR